MVVEDCGSQISSSRLPPLVGTNTRLMCDGSGRNLGSCCVHFSLKSVTKGSTKSIVLMKFVVTGIAHDLCINALWHKVETGSGYRNAFWCYERHTYMTYLVSLCTRCICIVFIMSFSSRVRWILELKIVL